MANVTLGDCDCPFQKPHKLFVSDGQKLDGEAFFSIESGTNLLDELIVCEVIPVEERDGLIALLQTSGLPENDPTEEEMTIESGIRSFSFFSESGLDFILGEARQDNILTPEQIAAVRAGIALVTEEQKIVDGAYALSDYDADDTEASLIIRQYVEKYVDPALRDRILAGAEQFKLEDSAMSDTSVAN